jgi:hypothetical protein
MAFYPVEVDRDALTIMGVPFASREALDRAARAIGSSMYEGFEPTPGLIEIYRDYVTGKIAFADLPALVRGQK